MRQWSSAVPLLAIVFASGYLIGRYSPAYPLPQAGHSMRVEPAPPSWHGPVVPDPRGQWILPEASPRDARPSWDLPPGHPAIPDDVVEGPAVDELGHDGMERNIVILHPREPMRT